MVRHTQKVKGIKIFTCMHNKNISLMKNLITFSNYMTYTHICTNYNSEEEEKNQ